MLLFLLGLAAGGLISMVIMSMFFVASREDERSELMFRTLTACDEKKIG